MMHILKEVIRCKFYFDWLTVLLIWLFFRFLKLLTALCWEIYTPPMTWPYLLHFFILSPCDYKSAIKQYNSLLFQTCGQFHNRTGCILTLYKVLHMLLAWNSLVLSQGWCSQCYESKPYAKHKEAAVWSSCTKPCLHLYWNCFRWKLELKHIHEEHDRNKRQAITFWILI